MKQLLLPQASIQVFTVIMKDASAAAFWGQSCHKQSEPISSKAYQPIVS